MTYTNLHILRNRQRTHIMVDDVTTLPSMFLTIYGMNELSRKSLGTQENIMISLRFFYVYYHKKYKNTFDIDFYSNKYNIDNFINELCGFFNYLLGRQHLNKENDILGLGFFHSEISINNKVTYGNHVRNVGKYFNYLNYRYMNVRFQDMSPNEAHKIHNANLLRLKDKIKGFNKLQISKKTAANRYKSITDIQSIYLNNMLLPSTPEFIDADTGDIHKAVINYQNPFKQGFQQYRNYLIHRLMFNYGLRVGEVLLLTKDCIGTSLPDSRGNICHIMVVQNLPEDVFDPRRKPASHKNVHSQRQIALTEDDYMMISIYIERYRDSLFTESGVVDHGILFIKGTGKLTPLTYDAVNTFYKKKIDPHFIKIYPYFRSLKNKYIDYMVTLTPHIGRHTWAYITLEFIYNKLLTESVMMSKDFGIRARMNGELDAAVQKLTVLGGWSMGSKLPLMYANRFIEQVANQANLERTFNADQHTATLELNDINELPEYDSSVLDEDEYEEFL